jgi:hypothetical protein
MVGPYDFKALWALGVNVLAAASMAVPESTVIYMNFSGNTCTLGWKKDTYKSVGHIIVANVGHIRVHKSALWHQRKLL